MKPQLTFSPVSLRYIAALRGRRPEKAGTEFTYAEVACTDAEALICLAASNPEGRFYGFVADEPARRTGEILAIDRGIFNAVFIAATPSQILARLANGSALPPMLDYLCCDQSVTALSSTENQALHDLAEKRLNAGGLLTVSYLPYDSEDGALRFLVRELVPEMNDDQKQELLTELKRLGTTFLSTHTDVSAKLTDAIIKGTPASFFAAYDGAPASSGTFDMTVAMRSRGMVYAGDANLVSNYVELAVPREAQDLVVKCREHVLYEPIKDLALNRKIRSDIWAKLPVEQSSVPAELFGGFAYGITMSRDQVPASFKAQGKDIDLSGALYVKLIDLMSTLPMGIGDFLSHPSGQGQEPEKIIEALQVLVACGIASPMRGLRAANSNTSSVAQPRLVGSFNSFLDKTDLDDKEVWFASSVMGCGVAVPAREAFVMQALNRAGLTNSVSALMPELRRIANTPSAKTIFAGNEPTAEIAQNLIRDVVGKSLPQWYAYALLSAA